MLRSLAAFVSLCLGGSAFADPPAAMYLFPAGGQKGTTVKFHAGGLYLNKSCALEMIGPGVEAAPVIHRADSVWFEGPLLPLPESQQQEDYPRAMAGSAKIAADARPGDRYVLLRTPQGVAGPLRFVVGNLPEVVEDEIDGEPVPVPVAAPVTVNGRIFPREDADIWAVTLKAGQSLSATVDASRVGSPLEARLDIRDPKGKRLVEAFGPAGRDPRACVTVREDGVYQVRITDTRADGGPAFVYRLTLTTEPVPEPKVDRDEFPVVRETDTADPVRGNFLRVPSTATGCIAAPGEIDRWGFSARKGDALEIALRAAAIESPLRGVLTVTDAAGKELARAESGPGPAVDPAIRFNAPADGMYFVTVRDMFASRGGAEYSYRVNVTRPEPGFDLSWSALAVTVARGGTTPLKVTARRHGSFAGPISLSIDGLPDGVTVAKELVLAPGQASIDISLKATATAKVQPSPVRVQGTGMLSLAPYSAMLLPVTKDATWTEDPAVDRVRLAVAVPTPFKIAGDYELKLIPRGSAYARRYRIERNGFAGPIEIDLADRQARHLQGVTGPRIVVPGDRNEFDYPITLPPWMEAGRTCRVCVMGTATVKDADGTEHVVSYSSREQNDQIIAVVQPERLGLRLDRSTVLVEPGKSAEVRVEVRRGEGVKGEATVNVIVPRGVRGVSAQPVTIPASSESAALKLHFGAEARGPFPLPLTIRATVSDRGGPVTAERKLELVRPR